jgi:hypothetical protein
MLAYGLDNDLKNSEIDLRAQNLIEAATRGEDSRTFSMSQINSPNISNISISWLMREKARSPKRSLATSIHHQKDVWPSRAALTSPLAVDAPGES